MSINCTNRCIYQMDGHCNLNALPAMTQQSNYTAYDTDCPYYQGTGNPGMENTI